jgi:hypothetical protein
MARKSKFGIDYKTGIIVDEQPGTVDDEITEEVRYEQVKIKDTQDDIDDAPPQYKEPKLVYREPARVKVEQPVKPVVATDELHTKSSDFVAQRNNIPFEHTKSSDFVAQRNNIPFEHTKSSDFVAQRNNIPFEHTKSSDFVAQRNNIPFEDSKIHEINYRKTGPRFKWIRYGYIKKRIRLWFFEEKSYLIEMELRNGMKTTFVVQDKEGGFRFLGGKYTFDDALKVWHIPSQLFSFKFHQDFTLPIVQKIDMNEINKAISGSNITDIEYMTNPSVLERFTVSKIAEGIMKGQQLDAFFRQIRLISIINLLISVILLIMFVFKTGMLKSIHIPGFS